MKKCVIILFMVSIYYEGIAQDEKTDKYFPLSAGSKWYYEFVTSSNWMKFKITDDDVNKGGKFYSELNIKYSWGNAYYRYEDGQYYIFKKE